MEVLPTWELAEVSTVNAPTLDSLIQVLPTWDLLDLSQQVLPTRELIGSSTVNARISDSLRLQTRVLRHGIYMACSRRRFHSQKMLTDVSAESRHVFILAIGNIQSDSDWR